MAQGNWKPDVIKPRSRCRLCGRVVKKSDMVRLDGVNPAHRACAEEKGREYTEGDAIFPVCNHKAGPSRPDLAGAGVIEEINDCKMLSRAWHGKGN